MTIIGAFEGPKVLRGRVIVNPKAEIALREIKPILPERKSSLCLPPEQRCFCALTSARRGTSPRAVKRKIQLPPPARSEACSRAKRNKWQGPAPAGRMPFMSASPLSRRSPALYGAELTQSSYQQRIAKCLQCRSVRYCAVTNFEVSRAQASVVCSKNQANFRMRSCPADCRVIPSNYPMRISAIRGN